MKEPIRIKHELFTGKRKNQRVGPRLVNVWETCRVFPTKVSAKVVVIRRSATAV